MQVSLLTKSKDKKSASFLVKGISPVIANLIRRYIIEEVPTMAIEDVEIRQNSSILYDEIIAHRLGLVPLSTDLKSYYLPEKCKCKGSGCARCTVKLTLKGKGPCTLLAGDIKSNDPKITPLYPKIPITKLLKGQQIELEAIAMLGKGKNNSKWSPCLVYYKYQPNIEIHKREIKDPVKVKESCPVNVFEIENNKLKVNETNLLKCHLCGACQSISNDVELKESENDFVFYLESWGQLTIKEIIREALDIFKEDLEIIKQIETIK